MDSLDIFDSGENGAPEGPAEGPKEAPEKQRAKSDKALAGIQKSRKDETKARKHSDILAGIFVQLLKDPKYDHILEQVLTLLRNDVPSIAILAFSAISFEPALRGLIEHCSLIFNIPVLTKLDPPERFDEGQLGMEERAYINLWVEVLFAALTQNISVLLTKKLIAQLDSGLRLEIVTTMTHFFEIFLVDIGRTIDTNKAAAYAGFILDQAEKRLRQTELEDF